MGKVNDDAEVLRQFIHDMPPLIDINVKRAALHGYLQCLQEAKEKGYFHKFAEDTIDRAIVKVEEEIVECTVELNREIQRQNVKWGIGNAQVKPEPDDADELLDWIDKKV